MVMTVSKPDLKPVANTEIATRLALVIEYDGTSYCGFQLQANRPTVQSALEKALYHLTGERIRVAASSRTDAGVHARGQVISFKTSRCLPLEAYTHGLNHHLPDDIAVKSAHEVGLAFDARRMAVSREYTYSILNDATRSPLTARFAHRVVGALDINAMNRACKTLYGTHDFASFASGIGEEPGKTTVRHVYHAAVTENHGLIVFTFVANAFIRHQVRNTAGALVEVGLGRMPREEFAALLDTKRPGLAGPSLPGCGLCLEKVNYPATFEEMR